MFKRATISTAQHSTAQHSTAQHSTAQLGANWAYLSYPKNNQINMVTHFQDGIAISF